MTAVKVTNSNNAEVTLEALGLLTGTVLSGGKPVVTLVLRSVGAFNSNANYQGHFELTLEDANILGEELRKAAEAATNKEDATHGTGQG